MAMLDIIKSSGVYLFRILEKNWRGVEKNRNETRCHPFPEPLFSEENLAFKGGVTRVSQQDWCFPKKPPNQSSKIPDFSKVLALQNSHEKRRGNHLPNKINLRKVVHLILHLRRGRLLHVLRSIPLWWLADWMSYFLMVFLDGFR